MMNRKLIVLVTTLIVALLVGLGAVLMSLIPGSASAQTEETLPERVIHVTGHGQVSAVPDTAVVRLGVQTEADTAVEALDENNALMTGVLSVTQEMEIPETNIQTTGLNLQPVYAPSTNANNPPQLIGYRATNTLQVTVTDLSQLGAFLDAAIEAGGNTIESIQFEVRDREALLAAAREAAMNDAMQKAEQLTSLAGAELGEVLVITEFGQTPPPPVPFALEAGGAEAAVPIAPGTQLIETTVQVSWRIR